MSGGRGEPEQYPPAFTIPPSNWYQGVPQTHGWARGRRAEDCERVRRWMYGEDMA